MHTLQPSCLQAVYFLVTFSPALLFIEIFANVFLDHTQFIRVTTRSILTLSLTARSSKVFFHVDINQSEVEDMPFPAGF